MKEIIKHIDGVAGRVVTVTGLTDTALTRDNVLGILNGTQNEVLYVPMFYGDLQSVTYSNGTLTITLADTVPAIANGDKLFVKLYADVEMATEAAATTNKEAIITAVSNAVASILGTNTAATLTAIRSLLTDSWSGLEQIRNALYYLDQNVAKEANATQNYNGLIQQISALYGEDETTLTDVFNHVTAVLTALAPKATSAEVAAAQAAIIAAMPTIPTDYAKQGSNSSATLSETQAQATAAANAADAAATSSAATRGNLGSDEDSAAETGTLFAIVKYIKNTVKSVYTSVGSALASAVAAIKGDTENIISTQAGHTTTLGNINTNMAKDDTVAKEATVNAGFAAGAKEATVNTNTAAIEQKIEDTFVKVDFTEDGLPLTREGGMCPITDGTDVFAGDYDMYSTHETSYTVGTIIQCTADNEFEGSSNVYAFIKAGASNLGISSSNAVTGTFEFGTWRKGHYYRVAQIIEGTDLNNETTVHIFTYEELPATIVEGFDRTKETVQAAKQAIKGSDAAATLTAIYAHLNGGGSLPADVQQQLTLILNYLGSPAAMECEGMTPQEVVDELEDIFGIMGLDIAPCSVDSEGNVTAPSES